VNRWVHLTTGVGAVVAAIIGTTITIDNRYAKSQEVQQQFCAARKQQLRDRIFELDLKPTPTAADKALREYLQQQLRDGC
jgi:Mn2+/Fe2+ NRAMP family transporter